MVHYSPAAAGAAIAAAGKLGADEEISTDRWTFF
jgi:hypothetical protein